MRFYYYIWNMYKKEARSIQQQIDLLNKRGLYIKDENLAKHWLSHVSYYRLAGYWWPMQSDKGKHIFKGKSKFSDVIALYNFDRELRKLVFSVIEQIEISLRTKLIYHLSMEHGPWWFQNFALFSDSKALVKTLHTIQEEVDRSKDIFIKEHKKKHKDDGRYPPAWKTLELTSFGALSKIYGNLKNTIKAKDTIAEDFMAVNHTFLPSWLQSIAQIRNFCAHHSRLWNRNLPGSLKLLPKPPAPWLEDVPKPHESQFLYIHLSIMKYLLNVIQPDNNFTSKLEKLFEKYPNVDPNALGMKPNWQNEKLWK